MVMKLTYIVTISPVIKMEYLNILVHSLNMQTVKDFDVIFYNQTSNSENEILSSLAKAPEFKHRFFSIARKHVFGGYPLWDLYGFHQYLLDNGFLGDYFMSLHMEEFLEPDYTSEVIPVLDNTGFDILLGNMYSTDLNYDDISKILLASNYVEFNEFLNLNAFNKAPKWGFSSKPFFLTKKPFLNLRKSSALKFQKQLKPDKKGYSLLNNYMFEDVFLMSRDFATRYQWFNSNIPLYFEDIHINWRLEDPLKAVTAFPAYFNQSRIFHLQHPKYYYQIENDVFTDEVLKLETDNPVILVLKGAIQEYRAGEIDAKAAVQKSRKTGSVIQNYEFHKKNIEEVRRAE